MYVTSYLMSHRYVVQFVPYREKSKILVVRRERGCLHVVVFVVVLIIFVIFLVEMHLFLSDCTTCNHFRDFQRNRGLGR